MDPTTLMLLMGQMGTQGGQMPPMGQPQQGQMPPAPATQGMSFMPQARGQFVPPTQPSQPPQQGGGGMFGGGGKGLQILASALNGFLASSRGPGQESAMQNLQAMAAQRQRMMEHQQSLDDYNRKRADDNADFVTHLQQKSQYDPPTGSEYERLLSAAGIMPGTPQYQQHVSAKVNQLENPMVMTPYGPMPYSSVNPAPPSAPVGKLTPIDGGQTGAPSGGFPY